MTRRTRIQPPRTRRKDNFAIDEETDIVGFQVYLSDLSPEALWDVLSHLDSGRYPRRHEAARREVERRRLFYVPPYTRTEVWLRWVFVACLALALLAAFMKWSSILLALWLNYLRRYTDLPETWRDALNPNDAPPAFYPVIRAIAFAGGIAALPLALYTAYLRTRRRARWETLLVAVSLTATVLALLYSLTLR